MTLRLSLTLLTIILVIVLPWWASGLVLLLFIFFFPWYYEAVPLAFLYDLLYGSGIFYITIAVLLIIPLVEWAKKRLYVFS
ncbi:MAG: hypothetical protein WC385_00300 [Candidatus Paceibacterota bacterium]|jgi:hypothetical protein